MAAPAPAPPATPALSAQATALARDGAAWLRDDSLTALIGLGIAIALTLALVTARRFAVRRLAIGTPAGSRRSVARRLIGDTRTYFLAAASADLVSHIVSPPGTWLRIIDTVFTIAAAVQGARWLRALVLGVVERRAEQGGADGDPGYASALGVIRVLVTVAVWALVVVLLLGNLGVDVTALVAGLGIGGIAIALAAQGIFADLFAALAILLDKPFQRGDAIAFDTVEGDVEAIGIKTTRLRAPGGEQIVISNAKLLNERIRNYRAVAVRRVVLPLGLARETPVDLLIALPADVAALVGAVEHCRFGSFALARIGDTALEHELVFHVDTPDYATMLAARHAVICALLRRLGELGVELARPTRVIISPPPVGEVAQSAGGGGAASPDLGTR